MSKPRTKKPTPPATETTAPPAEDTPAEDSQISCPLCFTAYLIEQASPVPGSVWEVVVLQEGWSRNGIYYTREAVASAPEVFEGAPVQFYAWNGSKPGHLPTDVRWNAFAGQGPAANNVGVLADCTTREHGGRLQAIATFYCTHPVLQESLRQYGQLPGHVSMPLGMSIDARGDARPGTAEGRRGPIVHRLTSRHELTVVVDPAAGGKFTRLLASEDQEEEDMLKSWLKSRRATKGLQTAGIDNLEGAQLLQECARDLAEDAPQARAQITLVTNWATEGKITEATQLMESLLQEAQRSAAPAPARPQPTQPLAVVASAEAQVTSLLESLQLKERKAELNLRLQEAKLPTKAEAMLRNRFSDRNFTDAELQAAIVECKEALAEVAPIAQVAAANPTVRVGPGPVERQQVCWDIVFGYDYERDQSLTDDQRAMYRQLHRSGREAVPSRLVEAWYDSMDQYQIGPNAILHEATSANYPQIMGTSMERRMVQVYMLIPDMSEQLFRVVDDIQSFKTQTRINLGGFGDIPTVTESTSNDYPTLERPSEVYSEYTLTKRGGLFPITWEMILADNLQVFREIPDMLGRAARTKKMKYGYGLVMGASNLATINSDQTYDNVVLYHASHGNTTTAALAQASLTAARTALRNQRRFHRTVTLGAEYTSGATSMTLTSTAGLGIADFIEVEGEILRVTGITSATVVAVVGAQCGTSAATHANGSTGLVFADPIMVDTFHLVVPTELAPGAESIMNTQKLPGGANNDYNVLYGDFNAGRIKLHPVNSQLLLGDVTNWYCVTDPSQVASIEFGYLRGQRLPLILVQDAPTVGHAFARDTITFKIRHVYGGKQVDWRGLYGGIVAG